jgi:hypothetical protein
MKNLRENRTLPREEEGLSEEVCAMILSMTERDPEKRPGAHDLLSSPEMENWAKKVEEKQ